MQIAHSEWSTSDRRDPESREHLLRRIRSEFEEMPCLRLTAAQARRLFGLRYDICERLLQVLVSDRTLTYGRDQRYKLREDADRGAWSLHSAAAGARGECHGRT
jgi:hypothetical protein